MPLPVKLTKLENEILAHRLEAPDCLAEAIEESNVDPDSVETVCAMLLDGEYEDALEFDRKATLEVLADAVEGSTYLGTELGNGRPQKERAILRAGESLADKLSSVVGRKLVYPNY